MSLSLERLDRIHIPLLAMFARSSWEAPRDFLRRGHQSDNAFCRQNSIFEAVRSFSCAFSWPLLTARKRAVYNCN
jgi:hypothetical protein